MGSRLINTNYNNFAPRLGIAWSPSNKWSIRTGFGIFYSQESKNSIFDLNRGMGGRTGQVTQTTYGQPTFTYQNFINTSALPVTIPIGLTWGADHTCRPLQHAVSCSTSSARSANRLLWRWVTTARKAAIWTA